MPIAVALSPGLSWVMALGGLLLLNSWWQWSYRRIIEIDTKTRLATIRHQCPLIGTWRVTEQVFSNIYVRPIDYMILRTGNMRDFRGWVCVLVGGQVMNADEQPLSLQDLAYELRDPLPLEDRGALRISLVGLACSSQDINQRQGEIEQVVAIGARDRGPKAMR